MNDIDSLVASAPRDERIIRGPDTGDAGLLVGMTGLRCQLDGSHLDHATREVKRLLVRRPMRLQNQLAGMRCCCRSTLTTNFCVAAALTTLAPAVVGG